MTTRPYREYVQDVLTCVQDMSPPEAKTFILHAAGAAVKLEKPDLPDEALERLANEFMDELERADCELFK